LKKTEKKTDDLADSLNHLKDEGLTTAKRRTVEVFITIAKSMKPVPARRILLSLFFTARLIYQCKKAKKMHEKNMSK